MIRGTTACFKFKLPYDFEQISSVKIIFWQDNNNGPTESRPLPIVKIKSQCFQTNIRRELAVNLTPEETLRFSDERKAYVQMTATAADGSRFASHQEMFTVYPVRDEDVSGGDGDIVIPPDDDGVVILDGGRI